MRPGGMMTGACSVMSGGLQSTQGSLGLMQRQFLYKVWSTDAEHPERNKTEIIRLEAECMFLGPNVSVEPFELPRSLPTSGWQRA